MEMMNRRILLFMNKMLYGKKACQRMKYIKLFHLIYLTIIVESEANVISQVMQLHGFMSSL